MIFGLDTDVHGDHHGTVVEKKHCFTSRHLLFGYYFIAIFLLFTPLSSADIRFEEVTQKAGFHYTGPTAGASWGDFNGDGWPDLWVGNHNGLFGTNTPSLYLNQLNGTFAEISKDVLSTSPDADFHGAAWADYDNDGDQDLIVLAGGGGGSGSSPNYLFVNQDSLLRDAAVSLNLDYPLGRGRTPLWFDADRDGLLDVLVMNRSRKDGQSPSAVFRQSVNGFEEQNKEFNFRNGPRSRVEKIFDLTGNLLKLRKRKRAGSIFVLFEFAQLGDISGDGALDLIAYSQPMRIYALNNKIFEDITNDFELENVQAIWDAAIEDFNGDGQSDVYFVRSSGGQNVALINSHELRGAVQATKQGDDTTAVHFRTTGNVTFWHYTPSENPTDPWGSSTDLFIGSRNARPLTFPFTLSPQDPWVRGPVVSTTPDKKGIWIYYEPDSQIWKLSSSFKRLNFKIRATKPIEDIEMIGFDPSLGEKPDKLLVHHEGDLHRKPLQGKAGVPNSCSSVAAGDYDNDMDIDLYLVCSGPVQNLPNRLLENDGHGNFTLISGAGGAAGSKLGRGDVVATADYNRDGFLDLFVTNGRGYPPFAEGGPHELFRNIGNENHWLMIDLVGTVSNRDGTGAHVLLETGGVVQKRVQSGGMHSFAQNHQRIHFGLGKHTKVDRITVRWPSGNTQQLQNVNSDQVLRIEETPVAP